MSSIRSEHDYAWTPTAAQRHGLPDTDLLGRAWRTSRPLVRVPTGPSSARCVVTLGSHAPAPVDKIVRRICGSYGETATLRRFRCLPHGIGAEYSVLRGLFGEQSDAWARAHRTPSEALAHVHGLVERAPLVLALVDAQWCDAGTLRWIDQLMRRLPGRPLTVLLSSSHRALGAADATFHEITTRDYCTVAEVADFLTAGAGQAASPDYDDLVRHDPHLLHVARAAAVLRSTDTDLVGALTRLPARLVGKALKAARSTGMIPEPMPPMGVSHPVDALLAELPEAESERMHAQAAAILNDAARPVGQVADLLLAQSTLDRPWMVSLLKEATASVWPNSPADAVRYLSRLRRLDPDDVSTRVDLATALLDTDPLAALDQLGRPLPRTAGPAAEDRTVVLLGLIALMTGERPDTPHALDEILGDLRTGVGTGPLSARCAPRAPRPGAVRTHTGPAEQAGPPVADHALRAGPRPATPPATAAPGRLALATRALRDALRGTTLQDTVDDAHQVLRCDQPRSAWATVAAARALSLADHTASALDHLGRAVAESRHREEVWAECHARSVQGWILLRTGELAEAVAQAQAALRIAEAHGWETQTALPLTTLAMAMLARSDTDGAERTLRRLDGRRTDGSVGEHRRLMAAALIQRRRGRPEEALELLDACGTSLESAGVGNPVFTTWWVASTDLLMRLGRADEAADRAERGRQLAERWPTGRSIGLSLLASGMVATGSARAELLAESVRTLATSPDRPYHVLAELHLGCALLELGDKKAARAHLHAARTRATQHGLLVLAGHARAALATAGGRAPAVGRLSQGVLTAAERPVAELAATGATNREIADALCLTVRTVEYHLTNAYRKLGVTGRTDLAERLDPDSARTPPRALGDPR
ncbi:helix-turn-helix transcriptional regulator [Streptomyces sp. NBC_01387]|uniref:helix-turn-helix transcriptional regulator n=1 Tax=Streptomyces sp. NBC_01387 TaxID=2903849 RepID=UPI0032458300